VEIRESGESVIISGNLLVSEAPGTEAVISLDAAHGYSVRRAVISNNLCYARDGSGIGCKSCEDITIQCDMVVAMGSCLQGIKVESETLDMSNAEVGDNNILVKDELNPAPTWNTDINITSRTDHSVLDGAIVGNSISGATWGITFTGNSFQRTPLCALNSIDDHVMSPLLGLEHLPELSVVVGGATSTGAEAPGSGTGRLLADWVGSGSPNNSVTGYVGGIFQRLDSPSGPRLYVK
jgi:hypothetical protein